MLLRRPRILTASPLRRPEQAMLAPTAELANTPPPPPQTSTKLILPGLPPTPQHLTDGNNIKC